MALAATGMAAVAGPAQAGAAAHSGVSGSSSRESVRGAYRFLDATADGYPDHNPGVRLAQSYADELGLFSTAFVYDNALAINAYLLEGTHRGRQRAELLGDGLLYAQDHDPGYSDGRLRQAYRARAALHPHRQAPLPRRCPAHRELDR
jgi:hypothetical protein